MKFDPSVESFSGIPFRDDDEDVDQLLYQFTESYRDNFLDALEADANALGISPETLLANEIARIEALDRGGPSKIVDGQFVPGSTIYVNSPSYGAFGFIAIDRFMRELKGERRPGRLLLLLDAIVDAADFSANRPGVLAPSIAGEAVGSLAATGALAGATSHDTSGALVGAGATVTGNAFSGMTSSFAYGRRLAQARWMNDPKTKDKAFVKECWLEWQKEPKRYTSKAEFARDMLTKCEYLISNRVIEDWVREWERNSAA